MIMQKSVVAIVDDDARLLDSLGDFLKSAGFAVRAFTSGRAFLDDESVPPADCLVTDITMPELDGFELQEAANEKRPDLPVIFITGTRDVETQTRVMELPSGRFFRKPFDAQDLVNAITKAVR
ncbi:response regulator [Rhizobium cauense]|uniref:response regulator transcription factor n=1 Tax=Rhizobium cauense TaxID=1166683 RepID=UPI001C6ED41A|nr:response regulator [Rhizobium cauense]MBW9116462.1 response regulator [Rhizobium cauense]